MPFGHFSETRSHCWLKVNELEGKGRAGEGEKEREMEGSEAWCRPHAQFPSHSGIERLKAGTARPYRMLLKILSHMPDWLPCRNDVYLSANLPKGNLWAIIVSCVFKHISFLFDFRSFLQISFRMFKRENHLISQIFWRWWCSWQTRIPFSKRWVFIFIFLQSNREVFEEDCRSKN